VQKEADTRVPLMRVLSRRPLVVTGGADGFFEAARDLVRKQAKGELAPLKIVDAVEAAVNAVSFKAGMRREAELFGELAAGPQSKALQQ